MKPLHGPEPHHDHSVQFYRDDAALLRTLSRFTREGLNAGQPVIIIGTPEHNAALTTQLVQDGLTPQYFETQGNLWLLDARETLAQFMTRQGTPDPLRFKSVIGGLIEQARSVAGGSSVRAYGEMVDLLWKDGNANAAIRLEVLWNTLAETHHFSLLCGYSIGSFYKEMGGLDIGDVCRVHARVLPA